MESVLYKQYKEQVVPALKKEFGYKNVMQVPRVQKIVLNCGYGKHVKDKNFIDHIEKTFTLISGQKPVHNKSRKSISNFKTRIGMNIGISVTLRGDRMFGFLDKLLNITLPRTRDFKGVSPKAVDNMGNLTIGIREHTIFPETSDEDLKDVFGLAITIVTSAKNKKEAEAYLRHLGLPLVVDSKVKN